MATLKTKLWVGVGAFVLAGVHTDPLKREGALDLKMDSAWAAGAATEDGEGGEGGEGGERGTASAAAGTVDYLQLLALVEGHLAVGIELFKLGATEAARSHMKHPSDELYASLVPQLKKYGVPSFRRSLEELALAVEQGQSAAAVDRAHQKVRGEIDGARRKAPAGVKTRLVVVAQLVRTAGDEYKQGVQQGRIINAHEYQDAYGFVSVARRLLDEIKPAKSYTAALAQARQALDELKPAWPALAGAPEVKSDASQLYAAASRIELAASSLR